MACRDVQMHFVCLWLGALHFPIKFLWAPALEVVPSDLTFSSIQTGIRFACVVRDDAPHHLSNLDHLPQGLTHEERLKYSNTI